jgi:hypothetical protein
MATRSLSARTIPFSGRAYKAVFMAHVVFALGWLGVDVVLLVLAVTGLTSDDARTVATAYHAMSLFTLQLLIPAGLLTLATGILLGLGSKFGLIRYWWVVGKLAINIVLTLAVLFALRPSINEAEEAGRELTPRAELGGLPADLVFPPAVSIVALGFATYLSIFKPWGRMRR